MGGTIRFPKEVILLALSLRSIGSLPAKSSWFYPFFSLAFTADNRSFTLTVKCLDLILAQKQAIAKF